MQTKKDYDIHIDRGVLNFRTSSFMAEEGSILHSGIYSRDLTSSLAAGAVIVALLFGAVTLHISMRLPHYLGAAVLFGILIVLFRHYVFYEEYLRTVIDKNHNLVTVSKKAFRSVRHSAPLEKLVGLRSGLTILAPQNEDGIAVVKHISAQHGMPIPGFGETRELHSVHLEFDDGETFLIFSTDDKIEAEAVLDMMKKFIGGSVAKKN